MANILVVDDSGAMRKAIKTVLTRAGHTVIAEAQSGAQAYIEYKKYRPEIVTMDIGMPDGNGLEAAEKILGSFPHAKIIFITAEQSLDVITKAAQLGRIFYIIKPITVDKVLNVLEKALNT